MNEFYAQSIAISSPEDALSVAETLRETAKMLLSRKEPS